MDKEELKLLKHLQEKLELENRRGLHRYRQNIAARKKKLVHLENRLDNLCMLRRVTIDFHDNLPKHDIGIENWRNIKKRDLRAIDDCIEIVEALIVMQKINYIDHDAQGVPEKSLPQRWWYSSGIINNVYRVPSKLVDDVYKMAHLIYCAL